MYHVNDLALAMGPRNIKGNTVTGVEGLFIEKDSGTIFQ